MKKRDKKKEKRELFQALAMVTQIGLSMMTCMAISFAIGFYLDRLLGTKFWVMIFLLIGILASLRSLFILTGRIGSTGGGAEQKKASFPPPDVSAASSEKEELDEGSKEDIG